MCFPKNYERGESDYYRQFDPYDDSNMDSVEEVDSKLEQCDFCLEGVDDVYEVQRVDGRIRYFICEKCLENNHDIVKLIL